MEPNANAFAEEQIKRAVTKCEDIQELRRLTLITLELLKMQRQVFDGLLRWPESAGG